MKEYIFPAVFKHNDDGTFTITFPDLPGCISEGKDLKDALLMSQSALTEWICYLLDKGCEVPDPSKPSDISIGDDSFVNMVYADLRDKRAVKRTVSIPKWLDERASEAGLSLSRILQDALKARL